MNPALSTAEAPALLFDAWSASLDVHQHALQGDHAAALDAIRRTERLATEALAALTGLRLQLDSPQTKP